MPSPVLVFLGFAAYAAVHSALLAAPVRAALEALVGPRAFRGTFRLGFSVQAAVLLGAYAVWAARLPDVPWGAAPGWAAWGLWAVKGAALAFIVRCVARFGAAEFLGWTAFRAWRRGETRGGDGVETGELVVGGPYRRVRHPMYAAGLVFLWAEPQWSANRCAFLVAASLYLWLGALHEERRLLAFYGQAYRAYLARTPRFVPRLTAERPSLPTKRRGATAAGPARRWRR